MLNLLIVDDDDAIRSMLAMICEQQNYCVTEASNAEEGIAGLGDTIDLVILDMGMPPHEHSAAEGLRVLDHAVENFSRVKVIVLTGQNPDATSFLAIKHGAFDFLAKPVESQQIINALNRASLFSKKERLLREKGLQKITLNLQQSDGVKMARNSAEEKLLKQVLQDTDFNVHEVARRLNVKRENVYYLIKKYGIERDEPRAET